MLDTTMTDETPETPDTGSPIVDALTFAGGATFVVLATLGLTHAGTELFRRKDKAEEVER
jgi:hypothetical protein